MKHPFGGNVPYNKPTRALQSHNKLPEPAKIRALMDARFS
jgi:hypothetical protein